LVSTSQTICPVHRHQWSPLFLTNNKTMRGQILFHALNAEIGIRVSPAEEKIEQFEVHAARLLDEESAVRFEHTPGLVDNFAPFRDVMQNAKDNDYISAGIGKLA